MLLNLKISVSNAEIFLTFQTQKIPKVESLTFFLELYRDETQFLNFFSGNLLFIIFSYLQWP